MIILGLFFLLNQDNQNLIDFDIPIKLVCKDVTPEALKSEKQKLVEIVFEVSAKINISEKYIEYIEIEINNLGNNFFVQFFLPSLELEDKVKDGEIIITQSDRSSLSLAATGFGIRPPRGAGAIGKYEHISGVKYTQIAPKKVVKSSGFSNNKHSVWFKLRPSNADSLEKPYQFAVLFVVPCNFQADLFSVSATAFIKESSYFFWEKIVPKYKKIFVVGAHLDDSKLGKDACDQLVELNKKLFKVSRSPSNQSFYYTMIKGTLFGVDRSVYLIVSGLESAYAYYNDNFSTAAKDLKEVLEEVKSQQKVIEKLNGLK